MLSPPLRRTLILLSAAALTSCAAPPRPAPPPVPYVVVLSLDGFRADYLDSLRPPHIMRLAERGARATGLVPIFPSKTFPNHYALVTGMYAEHHGIVANVLWDPARQARFALGDTTTVRDGSWYRGEPIWVTAERQGVRAASLFWPGAEATIGGVRLADAPPYDVRVPDSVRVDSVLAWLARPAGARPHLVTAYSSVVDDSGHAFGPGTPAVAAAVRAADAMVGRLLAGLAALPIRDSTYVVLVSDHGMARVMPSQFEALDTMIDTVGVRIADAGPNANLHVRGGAGRARLLRDSLNRHLRHGRAWLRTELPDSLHYRGDPRAGDVVVVMEMPWLTGRTAARPTETKGAHGWAPWNREMHGILVMVGPRVRAGARLAAVQNVDVYPLLAELLGLRAAPDIDGRAGRIAGEALQGGRP